MADNIGVFNNLESKSIARGDTLTVNCTLYTVNCLSSQRLDKLEFVKLDKRGYLL